jgi:hypothetical protein
MFNPIKQVMSMYMPLVTKMAKHNPSFMVAKVNFELLYDVNLIISLSCLIHMLKIIHALIKFMQKLDVFVCDYVVAIKIFQRQFYFHYFDLATKYTFDVFKEFQYMVNDTHNIMHLKWKPSSLDLNNSSAEYLCFDYVGFIF